jgi:membrane-associated protease RseP (regulator of RpoE activity)
MAIGVLAFAAIACAFVVARWLGGRRYGARMFKDALTTLAGLPYEEPAVRYSRAVSGIVAWYLGAALVGAWAAYTGGETHVDDTSLRVSLAPDGPAARAGIRDGDRVLAVEGERVASWDVLRRKIADRAGEPTRVTVERNGAELDFEPIPDGLPARISVGPFREHRDIGLGAAMLSGLTQPFEVLRSIARGTARTIAGADKPELSGPVGIVREVELAREPRSVATLRFVTALAGYALPFVALVSLLAALRPNRPSAKRRAEEDEEDEDDEEEDARP